MLKTLSRVSSSLAALLGEPRSNIDTNAQLQQIQATMLNTANECTGQGNATFWSTRVREDISRACDIQTLWYLRSDLLRILSDHCGEQAGRKKLDEITEMFRGNIPKDQMPGSRRIGR